MPARAKVAYPRFVIYTTVTASLQALSKANSVTSWLEIDQLQYRRFWPWINFSKTNRLSLLRHCLLRDGFCEASKHKHSLPPARKPSQDNADWDAEDFGINQQQVLLLRRSLHKLWKYICWMSKECGLCWPFNLLCRPAFCNRGARKPVSKRIRAELSIAAIPSQQSSSPRSSEEWAFTSIWWQDLYNLRHWINPSHQVLTANLNPWIMIDIAETGTLEAWMSLEEKSKLVVLSAGKFQMSLHQSRRQRPLPNPQSLTAPWVLMSMSNWSRGYFIEPSKAVASWHCISSSSKGLW